MIGEGSGVVEGKAAPAEAVSRREFDELFDACRVWGRWGPDDERGALNLITAECVIEAAGLVRSGRSVSLALPLDTEVGPANKKPSLHYMSQLADRDPGEPRANMDFIALDFHGKAVTHLDALCHMVYRDNIYNQRTEEVVNSTGAAFGAVTVAGDGVVGRGVLLDLPRLRGEPFLEPGTAIYRTDLEEAERAEGIEVRAGDVVLLRTGHYTRRRTNGAWDASNLSAGLHVSASTWLRDRQVAILGSDGDSDLRPSPVPGVHSPIHAIAIVAMGIHLLDNLQLDDLAVGCSQEARWEFLVVAAPLRIPGGTGSPLNPIAVL